MSSISNGKKRTASVAGLDNSSNAVGKPIANATTTMIMDDPIESDIELNDFDQDELTAQDATTVAASNASPTPSTSESLSTITPKEPFRNLQELIRGCGNTPNSSTNVNNEQTEYLREMNSTIIPLKTSHLDEKLLEDVKQKFSIPLDMKLPLCSMEESWNILLAINQRRLDDEPAILTALEEMKTLYKNVASLRQQKKPISEQLESELHAKCSIFFKRMIVSALSSNKKRRKFLRPMIDEDTPTFLLLETESPTLQYLQKRSLNFSINVNTAKLTGKRNLIFSLNGHGVVLATTREAKGKNGMFTSFGLEENCNAYMNSLIYSMLSEQIPKLMHNFAQQIFFNLVQTTDLPNIPCLDGSKMRPNEDLYLLHVTFEGGSVQPARSSDQMILVITMYVNYILSTK